MGPLDINLLGVNISGGGGSNNGGGGGGHITGTLLGDPVNGGLGGAEGSHKGGGGGCITDADTGVRDCGPFPFDIN